MALDINDSQPSSLAPHRRSAGSHRSTAGRVGRRLSRRQTIGRLLAGRSSRHWQEPDRLDPGPGTCREVPRGIGAVHQVHLGFERLAPVGQGWRSRFLDEAHELQKIFQTSLYLAIDKRQVIVCGSKAVQNIPLASFTLLLGTTDEFCLLPATP